MGGSGGFFLAVIDIKEVVYSLAILQLILPMNQCNLYVVIPGTGYTAYLSENRHAYHLNRMGFWNVHFPGFENTQVSKELILLVQNPNAILQCLVCFNALLSQHSSKLIPGVLEVAISSEGIDRLNSLKPCPIHQQSVLAKSLSQHASR